MTNNRPRHPVYWPRMKVRGAKRKYLTNLRRETRVIVRGFVTQSQSDIAGYRMDFVANPAGNVMIEAKTIRDGWGRTVR